MPAAGRTELPADDHVVDVTSWAVIRDEPGGRDPNKRWLAADPDATRHTGKIMDVGELADIYGFTDLDGRQPHWFEGHQAARQ